MNRIDRYISLLFWGFFLGSLLVLMTLFLAIDVMSTMVTFKGLAASTLAKYYAYYSPEIFNKMLPVVCLLGSVLTISNLNRNNELVALFASGMSLFRIVTPVLLWVLLISAFGYYVADQVLPRATRQKNYVYYYEMKKQPGLFSTLKTDRIWYRSKNTIFNIKTLSVDGMKAQGVTLYFFSEAWDLLEMLTAKEVEFAGNKWTLREGSITIFSEKDPFPLTSNYKQKNIEMTEDGDSLKKSGMASEVLSQQELNYFIRKNKEAGLDTLRYEVDYHSKFGFGMAGLVMCFIGIPFCVGRARSGGMVANLGISLALVFAYWVLLSSFLTLGQHGHIAPVLAAWSPNFLMSALGIWLMWRLKK